MRRIQHSPTKKQALRTHKKRSVVRAVRIRSGTPTNEHTQYRHFLISLSSHLHPQPKNRGKFPTRFSLPASRKHQRSAMKHRVNDRKVTPPKRLFLFISLYDICC
uniref:Nuclear receptor domain-containing protein n=1 Tax=Parascaris univalens TaxID=6257 RepID=A0A914ZIZ6_PARUN